jgi:ABC-type uncharacterized transport system involved in gliding motility auxiliary subunit
MKPNFYRKPAFGRLGGGLALLVLLILTLYTCSGVKSDTVSPKRPVIGLMTTLPLRWQEGDIGDVIGSAGIASPAFERISIDYDIRSIDNLGPKSLDGVSALMLAQSRALSPGELVDLDAWVRKGGKLLVLADPALHWESIYPLGDKRRPLFTSLLSPLFAHWGLELVLPVAQGDEKYQIIVVNEQTIRTVTVGAWQALSKSTAQCSITENKIIAKCKIGDGRVILVADADLLDAEFWQGSGVRSVLGSDDFANIDWIKKQLGELTSR